MTITEIKAAISAKESFNLGTLSMVRQYNDVPSAEDPKVSVKTPTEWVSHWDNDNRVRITMHQEIMSSLVANPTKADLAYKREELPATTTRAAYVRYIIITPKDIEATF